jgi:hypothetical protein
MHPPKIAVTGHQLAAWSRFDQPAPAESASLTEKIQYNSRLLTQAKKLLHLIGLKAIHRKDVPGSYFLEPETSWRHVAEALYNVLRDQQPAITPDLFCNWASERGFTCVQEIPAKVLAEIAPLVPHVYPTQFPNHAETTSPQPATTEKH